MRHNKIHAEIISDTSINENKTDYLNFTIENINAPATPAKSNKQQLNRKKMQSKKDKNQNKKHKN